LKINSEKNVLKNLLFIVKSRTECVIMRCDRNEQKGYLSAALALYWRDRVSDDVADRESAVVPVHESYFSQAKARRISR